MRLRIHNYFSFILSHQWYRNIYFASCLKVWRVSKNARIYKFCSRCTAGLPSTCSFGRRNLSGSSRLPSSAASRSTETERCFRFFFWFNGTLGAKESNRQREKEKICLEHCAPYVRGQRKEESSHSTHMYFFLLFIYIQVNKRQEVYINSTIERTHRGSGRRKEMRGIRDWPGLKEPTRKQTHRRRVEQICESEGAIA
jgi:hypothetical protein